ncbi:capsid protein [Marmot herpesvirus 1]|nr:capsid protein [Marmot herpesvirus 1]
MNSDKSVVISLASRLFSDEMAALQARVGSVVTLKDSHKLQNISSIGLGEFCNSDVAPDFIQMYFYISKCTLAVLDQVDTDSITLTKINPQDIHQFKNVYKPLISWDSYGHLCVIPPIFGIENSTVRLESNGTSIVFPFVAPEPVASSVIQKLLLYNLYARIATEDPQEVDMQQVMMYTTNVDYLGQTYHLDIRENDPLSVLTLMDELTVYISILTGLIPLACRRFLEHLVRQGQHQLVNVFAGIVPQEFAEPIAQPANILDDLSRMEAFIGYLQCLSSLFNLGRSYS